jgi:hypothetical protein
MTTSDQESFSDIALRLVGPTARSRGQQRRRTTTPSTPPPSPCWTGCSTTPLWSCTEGESFRMKVLRPRRWSPSKPTDPVPEVGTLMATSGDFNLAMDT